MFRRLVGPCLVACAALTLLLSGHGGVARAASQATPGASAAKPILTPKAPASPRINGPRVYGARPGHPFLYRIPATGARPMTFSADGLPTSLRLDPATGIIAGTTPDQRGEYRVTLRAANGHGTSSRPLRIVIGDTLALTPPMGWNDWYTHYDRITDKLLRQAADAMIASGMADYGYQFVNIDDCWMTKADSKDPVVGGPPRDGQGNIRPNSRFPDMKALTDYIHAQGLKAGIYTSPGPHTCASFTGLVPARGAGRAAVRQRGASTSSSTTGARTREWSGGTTLRRSKAALRADGRDPREERARHHLQPVPVRHERRVDVGRRGRRPLLANDRRPRSREEHAPAGLLQHRLQERRARGQCRPRPLERPRLHPDRIGRKRLQQRRAAEADEPHRRRAVQLHVDVGADGRAAVLLAAT